MHYKEKMARYEKRHWTLSKKYKFTWQLILSCIFYAVTLIGIYPFIDEVMQTTYCEIELDKPKRDAFVYAIKNHYWYQMYIDDLPIWGEY